MTQGNEKKTRNRGRKLTREMFGRKCVCPELAAKLLGCSRSTLDLMYRKSRKGLIKPAIPSYRDTPKSPIWYPEEELEAWYMKRMKVSA